MLGEFFAGSTAGLGYAVKTAQARPIQLLDQLWGSIFVLGFIGAMATLLISAARTSRPALAQLATSLSRNLLRQHRRTTPPATTTDATHPRTDHTQGSHPCTARTVNIHG